MRPKSNANRKQPKPEHIQMIEEMAGVGHSITNISKAVGVSKELFYVWREKFPEVGEALERGKDRERMALHNALYEQAMKGNTTAAIFLLKARHGYKEYEQQDQTNRVNITFELPAPAQDLGQYMKTINPPKEIGNAD